MRKFFFKNEWYYWYNGQKNVAILGWFIRTIINLIIFFFQYGNFGVLLGIILSFLNDILLILAIVILLFFDVPFFKDYVFTTILTLILSWVFSRIILITIAKHKV